MNSKLTAVITIALALAWAGEGGRLRAAPPGTSAAGLVAPSGPLKQVEDILRRIATLKPADQQRILMDLEQRLHRAAEAILPPNEARLQVDRIKRQLRRPTLSWAEIRSLLIRLDQFESVALEQLSRQYRVANQRAAAGNRAWLDSRQQALAQAYRGWQSAGSPIWQRGRLIDWLAEAIDRSRPGQVAALPAPPQFAADAPLLAADEGRRPDASGQRVSGRAEARQEPPDPVPAPLSRRAPPGPVTRAEDRLTGPATTTVLPRQPSPAPVVVRREPSEPEPRATPSANLPLPSRPRREEPMPSSATQLAGAAGLQRVPREAPSASRRVTSPEIPSPKNLWPENPVTEIPGLEAPRPAAPSPAASRADQLSPRPTMASLPEPVRRSLELNLAHVRRAEAEGPVEAGFVSPVLEPVSTVTPVRVTSQRTTLASGIESALIGSPAAVGMRLAARTATDPPELEIAPLSVPEVHRAARPIVPPPPRSTTPGPSATRLAGQQRRPPNRPPEQTPNRPSADPPPNRPPPPPETRPSEPSPHSPRVNNDELRARIAGTNLTMRALAAEVDEITAQSPDELAALVGRLRRVAVRANDLKLFRRLLPPDQQRLIEPVQSPQPIARALQSRIEQTRAALPSDGSRSVLADREMLDLLQRQLDELPDS